jgi:hypothetical protein
LQELPHLPLIFFNDLFDFLQKVGFGGIDFFNIALALEQALTYAFVSTGEKLGHLSVIEKAAWNPRQVQSAHGGHGAAIAG